MFVVAINVGKGFGVNQERMLQKCNEINTPFPASASSVPASPTEAVRGEW